MTPTLLTALDDALARHAFPRMSPWWFDTLCRFYASGKRQLVQRVGRRGGKSTMLCRVAVLEAIYGQHKIPPGDVGVIAIVSVSRDEAASRIRTIASILTALGVKYRRNADVIELEGRPILFKVFAASISGVAGFTCICAICDEVAKWRDAETGANPAKEVLGSLRPLMATMPSAKMFLSSSPMSNVDAHSEAFELGDTEFQITAFAPTWIANPSISEQRTRELEPDTRIWSREYAAVPQASVCGAFDEDTIEHAFRDPPQRATWGGAIRVVDPSSGRGDSFTSAWAQWCKPLPLPYMYLPDKIENHCTAQELDPRWLPELRSCVVISDVLAIDGAFSEQMTAEDVTFQIAKRMHKFGIRKAYGDQRESFSLTSLFKRVGIDYVSLAWSQQNKESAVARLRRLFAEQRIVLPKDDTVFRRELLDFQERITPNGSLSYGARRGGHDDRAALLLTMCNVDNEGLMPLSPSRTPRGMNQTSETRFQL